MELHPTDKCCLDYITFVGCCLTFSWLRVDCVQADRGVVGLDNSPRSYWHKLSLFNTV